MSEFVRQAAPKVGSEKELLAAFIDFHRATLLMKVDGLSEADLRRAPTASSLTLLGLIKHQAFVERWWFQAVFAGREVSFPWTDADPDADWRVEPDETAEGLLQFYKEQVAESRKIFLEAENLDEVAQAGKRQVSRRWIALHMIEEIARHNGHADILRESIDGATGE